MLVVCATCGASFELSRRNVRAHDRNGKQHVCSACRNPPKPPDEAQMARLRRWWLDRYSLEELRSWPPIAE